MIICTLPVFSQNKDAVLGKWLNANGEGQILIYKAGDHYYGRLIWLKKPTNEDGTPKLDSKNPNIPLQKRALLGAEILKGFVYTENMKQHQS